MVDVVDVEVYPNFFCCTTKDFVTKKVRVFEISERKNDLEEMIVWLRGVKYMLAFNNIHYDNIILMFFLKEYHKIKGMGYEEITKLLKQLNDLVIMDDNGLNRRKYSAYKYNQPWISIDLFLYWSKLLRISKKLSLKSLAVNINWPKIQELPLGPSSMVPLDQIDNVIKYNINDVDVTDALADRMSPLIALRNAAKKKYGFDCLSWDGVKLGLNVLLKRYCDRTGKSMDEVKELRTQRSAIDIGALIMPIIKFKAADDGYTQSVEDKALVTKFNSFYGCWKYLKGLKVTNTNQINCQIFFKGQRYDVKSGGLHTYHNPEVVVPPEGWLYKDKDVSSYYPTLGGKWGKIPEHLGLEFAEELETIRQERLQLKADGKGKSDDAELLKLSMNGGFYGNTNNEYTPMLDRRCMLDITINGQLMLLMLCERLDEIGVKIDMCNTDGVTILYPKELHDKVEEVCKEWEQLTRMDLETVTYHKVVRMNINNYMAVYEDKGKTGVKEKGMFLTKPPIDQSRDLLVIAKALAAYFKDGVDPEKFIREHEDIYDFCAAKKVDKKYKVFWNGKEQQRLNRYYICDRGPYLYKSPDGEAMTHMMKGWSVQLFNDYVKKEMKDYGINYNYYIAEAKKLINELEPIQATLF